MLERDPIVEEHIEHIKNFLTSTHYEWAIRHYNSAMVKKMTNLQRTAISDNLSKVNTEAGAIGGFKEGFEFLERITKGGNEGDF